MNTLKRFLTWMFGNQERPHDAKLYFHPKYGCGWDSSLRPSEAVREDR